MSGAGNSHGSSLSATAVARGRRKSRRPPRQLKFVPPPRDLPEALLHFRPLPLHFSPPIDQHHSVAAAEEAEGPTATAAAGIVFSIPQELPAAPPPRLVNVMTEGLLDLFHACNPAFHYDRRLNPRRVLTKPSKPAYNSGYDNEKHDYILYVNDIIGNEEGRKYVILDLLGQGTFGQVVKCQRVGTRELVAVKVIKNQTAFFNQSMMEVTVLEMLNQRYDQEDRHHIVRMRDTFVFRQHLCIVVELLSLNLYELIKQNQYRGFSLTLCRIFLQQILDALKVLKEARFIHCDLKPENILLKSLESPAVKVIDYGSACHEHQTLYTYIQSRFYRSPEVLLGLPYSASIDMWSLGCIAAELFLGLPIFPGASNYDQISRIVQTLGNPPNHMLEVGKDTLNYFERSRTAAAAAAAVVTAPLDRLDRSTSGINGGVSLFQLKSRERYNLDTGRMEAPPKQYFNSTKLDDIVLNYPIRPRDMSPQDREVEMQNRRCFLDFVKGLLNLNPIERWSPMQAAQHPFITGRPFTGPFVPPVATAPIPMAVASGHKPRGALPASPSAARWARPRANTLSSLSLQDVPPQIQRLAAANKETNAPGVVPADRRSELPVVPPDHQAASASINDHGTLPLEAAAMSGGGDDYLLSTSVSPMMGMGSAGRGGRKDSLLLPVGGVTPSSEAAATAAAPHHQAYRTTKPLANTGTTADASHVDRMGTYVNNRRASQPVVAWAGRYAAGRPGNAASAAGIVPASLPNAVWYGPEPFGMSPGSSQDPPSSMAIDSAKGTPRSTRSSASLYYNNRRGSREGAPPASEGAGNSIASNTGWRSPIGATGAGAHNGGGGRRGSIPGDGAGTVNRGRRPSSSALSVGDGLIEDEMEVEMGSGSSSMMDVLDEVEEPEPPAGRSNRRGRLAQ